MAQDKPEEISSAQREFSRRRFLRNAGVVASLPLLGSIAGILDSEAAGAQTYKRNADHPFFASHRKYHFVMDNPATTNSFFTPTLYGCQDFCTLAGCTFSWVGSLSSVVSEMVSTMDVAIASKAAGIGVTLIDGSSSRCWHPRDCLQRGRVARRRQQPDGLRRPVERDSGRSSCRRDLGQRCTEAEQG
jgi:hypothetical protein